MHWMRRHIFLVPVCYNCFVLSESAEKRKPNLLKIQIKNTQRLGIMSHSHMIIKYQLLKHECTTKN